MEKNTEKDFEREVLDRLIKIESKIELQDYKSLKKTVDDTENRSINNEKQIEQLDKRLTQIESKPQKRYDNAVNQVISFVLEAILVIVAVKIGLK